MRRSLNRMSAGLAIGITVAVATACGVGAYLYSLRHFNTLLETARGTAVAQAELIRAALEHGMIEEDRTLIASMIRSFGSEPGVANVMLLDRQGTVQHSSGQSVASGSELSLQSPTCQACHQFPAAQRMTSRVLETGGGSILRTVVPVRNRAECHGCHDPARRINGLVIFDLDATRIRQAANRDLRWLALVSAGLALLLIGAIAVVVRVFVLRRLQRFETTARLISEGHLDRRVPASGSDTISWLAREFNVMADSVTGLLGEVRSERERLERVINSIDDGIVVLDAERKVIAANDAFLQRTGGLRAAIVGCSCQDTPSAMCTVADCPAAACLETGGRQIRICERRRSDGTMAWEEVHASPVPGAPGEPSQVVEVWRDISERRAAEARLAESHRLASLGLLASGFSHEMNTPLGTVLTCVEGIGREVRQSENGPDWERVAENAAIAREQVLRCRGITQHFLRMARGQATNVDLVDLHDAVGAVARLIEPTARDRDVAVELTPPGGCRFRVRASEADLHHALMNLVLNAVQASRPGTTVRLSVTGDHASVRVRISDQGCGIAEDQQKRIFEPFFSLRIGGTGLGLFLSLNFVRQWGGDIHVRSASGEGATFEVVLPSLVLEEVA
jgi:PAS domain S-box-containing protein